MMRPNPVEEAVLQQWGLTAISEEADDPERALEMFLAKIKDRVDAE
jgi:hypothetical protein